MIYAEFTRAYANFLTGHSRNLHMSGVLFRKYYRDLSQLIYHYRTQSHYVEKDIYEKIRLQDRVWNGFLREGVPLRYLDKLIAAAVRQKVV